MTKKKSTEIKSATIATNKKAYADYFVEKEFDAGLVLQGWEVKSLRSGKAQLRDAYVMFKHAEAFILGLHISPLLCASSHIQPDPVRSRKLLLHKKEIAYLTGAVQQSNYTCVPLKLYWKRHKVKCNIALAKGKKNYDKRQVVQDRQWRIQQGRIMKETLNK